MNTEWFEESKQINKFIIFIRPFVRITWQRQNVKWKLRQSVWLWMKDLTKFSYSQWLINWIQHWTISPYFYPSLYQNQKAHIPLSPFVAVPSCSKNHSAFAHSIKAHKTLIWHYKGNERLKRKKNRKRFGKSRAKKPVFRSATNEKYGVIWNAHSVSCHFSHWSHRCIKFPSKFLRHRHLFMNADH